MAASFSIVGVESVGNLKMVHGTFTSAAGDSDLSMASTDHGLNYIAGYQFTTDTGGINTPNPQVTISGGTMTVTVDNSQGYSGKFMLFGR